VGLAVLAAKFLEQGVFIALVLSTTSLGLVLPTLMELSQTRTPQGQWILIASTLADFLTLLGITLFLLWNRHGFDWRFLSPLPLFLGFALVLRLVKLWAWWNPDKVERILASTDSQELGVRFSLALLFLFVALSELVHLEPVLGAFLGGCVLSWVFREKGRLDDKLSGIAFGFLIPMFLFTWV
jgi:Kef-type K+ transport system membrane component KefB